jgi:four helix bundle protein
MKEDDLKQRTKRFALSMLDVVDQLPSSLKGATVARQLVRAGTSVGANYRAACRARSKAEFVAKLGTVIEEADESAFWIELALESGLLKGDSIVESLHEANQLVAIMTASRKTAAASLRKPK